MKPTARIASTIDLISRIEGGRIPMDAVIRDFMAHRRFIGSKDRTDIVERAYAMMRAKARLGWWAEQARVEPTSRARMIAYLLLCEGRELSSLDEIFNSGQYDAPTLSDAEKTFAAQIAGKSFEDPAMPQDIRAECPPWAFEKLQTLYGEEFDAKLSAMIAPAPLDLRVNTLKGSVDEAIASLAKDGIKVSRTPYSPVGLRAQGKPFMGDSKAYKSGLVEIQDEGSQLIGLLCNAQPGQRLLDYCAGGGGKTLVLASSMQNKGNIVAMDNDTGRLEKGRPRYKKAGIHNVELRSLSDEQHRKWLRRQKGTMDAVLVDAPCSSSGTWRRNPDLRWWFYGPSLEQIMESQSEILERVAEKVKPGGRLVYATCSLLREENEAQIEKFLQNHPDYKILPVSKALPKGASLPDTGDFMRLNPQDHNTDGFFAAVLIRD